MEWQPIETYDALPNQAQPKFAVFLFCATPSRNGGWCNLMPTIQTQRYYGARDCTHWLPLAPPPKDPLEPEPLAKLARRRERAERATTRGDK